MKTVSILIPCRNEEKCIGKYLNSIVNGTYSKEKLEVFVIDGMSEDGTRGIVKEYAQKYPFINLLDNPKKIVPTALNIGIKEAKGGMIMRMDAHTTYEKDYVSRCVKYLNEYNVDNIGGICVTVPGSNTIVSKAITMILSSPFGVGNSYFRIGSKEPRFVDTVPFGCYKREVFNRIGLFNENLVRNQDIEFNLRLKKTGGKILLVPDIVSYYHARSSLKALAKNNFQNGFWVIYCNKFAKISFSLRHLVPFFFVLSLIGSLVLSLFYKPFIYLFCFTFGLHLIANILFSFKISLQNSPKYFAFLILSFVTLHFSYGFGSLWGLVKMLKRGNVRT